MLALVVDTSAHPRDAHPRAMCYKCYDESISLTPELLSPQDSVRSSYTDGAPPWTPTNKGHGITSRPLKHDPKNLTYSNTSILSTFGIKESIKANHLLAQLLAQAAGSRSGDGSKKEAGVHAGSRLGETPLAWARCSLAQKRDWLAWARLSGLATVFLQHPSTNSPKTTHWYIHSSHIITSTTGPRNNSQITWKK
ncbi:hypothetical protein DEO72_LG3g815 [Vigna unguiculata]|uniref:Uncharacterized protein n=1 Tax=Vigna unguiculata TaxID=3917 RepID=A0A4D6LDF3_VIGUN|nr:hypothetical protein DEO72_LG3g815 [Vigna unguiculata]